MQQLPRLQQIGSQAFASSITAMRKGQPVIDFLRPYSPDLVGWFRDFGQSAANYDANGHYARIAADLRRLPVPGHGDGSALEPVPPSQRLAGLDERLQLRRCPGAASQPRPDGSNPFAPAGFDCNPRTCSPAHELDVSPT